VNQIYHGCTSWTNTKVPTTFGQFTQVATERMMDYRRWGAKNVHGPNAKIKRYYKTKKEFKGEYKRDMPFATYGANQIQNTRMTTFLFPFYST